MTAKRPSPAQVQRAVMRVLAARGTATACPSEVARALAPHDWRPMMEPVRTAVASLQRRGKVEVYQRGRAVRIDEARGPIRLRQRASGTSPSAPPSK